MVDSDRLQELFSQEIKELERRASHYRESGLATDD